MRRVTGVVFWTVCGVLLLGGCASYRDTYRYLASTDDSRCETFHLRDGAAEYLFRASYRMNDGVLTTIDITFINRSAHDTLSTDLGSVRVSSRNIPYQYNDRFLPLPALTILPKRSDHVTLNGRDISGHDDWTKIAGERLTVSVKGLRLGGTMLGERAVEFVPENPRLHK
jgi:hypothetical protein